MLAWIPGKVYYTDGVAPAVLAAGALAAERWIARARRPRLRRGLVLAAALVGVAVILPFDLPLLPLGDVHNLPASYQKSAAIGDSIGWPQFTRAVAAQDAALVRPATGLPRSSPDTTERRPLSTCSAVSTTCRPCSPATTPTGCGDQAGHRTAGCWWWTRSGS